MTSKIFKLFVRSVALANKAYREIQDEIDVSQDLIFISQEIRLRMQVAYLLSYDSSRALPILTLCPIPILIPFVSYP